MYMGFYAPNHVDPSGYMKQWAAGVRAFANLVTDTLEENVGYRPHNRITRQRNVEAWNGSSVFLLGCDSAGNVQGGHVNTVAEFERGYWTRAVQTSQNDVKWQPRSSGPDQPERDPDSFDSGLYDRTDGTRTSLYLSASGAAAPCDDGTVGRMITINGTLRVVDGRGSWVVHAALGVDIGVGPMKWQGSIGWSAPELYRDSDRVAGRFSKAFKICCCCDPTTGRYSENDWSSVEIKGGTSGMPIEAINQAGVSFSYSGGEYACAP